MNRAIHEIYDVIFKLILTVYGVEFLKYIGIDKQIERILKTEFITMEGKKIYLDFLCKMKDKTLTNIEFQFPKAQNRDMKRFFNYNIIVEVTHASQTETVIINFTTKKSADKPVKMGLSKSFHPKQIYLGDINFDEYWRKINIKAQSNLKLNSFEEITLMINCLIVKCENKAEKLKKISKLLKNKQLFDKNKFDFIEAIINLQIENLITQKERNEIK